MKKVKIKENKLLKAICQVVKIVIQLIINRLCITHNYCRFKKSKDEVSSNNIGGSLLNYSLE